MGGPKPPTPCAMLLEGSVNPGGCDIVCGKQQRHTNRDMLSSISRNRVISPARRSIEDVQDATKSSASQAVGCRM